MRYSATKVRKLMRRRALTGRALSARAGIHWVTLSRFLTSGTCSFGTADRLAKTLGVGVSDLIVKGR